ncbi:MAG: discoidin domain-containing protein, partial [Firmicutes bacterium]|nr:discoidin domain-containing protein [Bacillota bacterium]
TFLLTDTTNGNTNNFNNFLIYARTTATESYRPKLSITYTPGGGLPPAAVSSNIYQINTIKKTITAPPSPDITVENFIDNLSFTRPGTYEIFEDGGTTPLPDNYLIETGFKLIYTPDTGTAMIYTIKIGSVNFALNIDNSPELPQATAGSAHGTFVTSMINDGITGLSENGWQNNSSNSGYHQRWVYIDFKSPVTFNEIVLYTKSGSASNNVSGPRGLGEFIFEYANSLDGWTGTEALDNEEYASWKNGSWSQIGDESYTMDNIYVTSDPDYKSFVVPTTTARYLMIRTVECGGSGSRAAGLAEIEVYYDHDKTIVTSEEYVVDGQNKTISLMPNYNLTAENLISNIACPNDGTLGVFKPDGLTPVAGDSFIDGGYKLIYTSVGKPQIVYEVVFGAVNLALRKPVESGSNANSTTAHMTNAVDGDYSSTSAWLTQNSSNNPEDHWLRISLGSKQKFNKVVIMSHGIATNRIQAFKLEGSDNGSTWSSIATFGSVLYGSAGDIFELDLPVTTAKYLKFSSTQSSAQQIGFREFEVYYLPESAPYTGYNIQFKDSLGTALSMIPTLGETVNITGKVVRNKVKTDNAMAIWATYDKLNALVNVKVLYIPDMELGDTVDLTDFEMSAKVDFISDGHKMKVYLWSEDSLTPCLETPTVLPTP